MRYRFGTILLALLAVLLSFGCREERLTTGVHRLSFSADTLRLDTLYTRLSSATARVAVYNRSKEYIRIEAVTLEQSEPKAFRVNVDGRAGTAFSDIRIPAGDSIFVFVEATFPEGASDLPEQETALLRFRSGAITDSVRIEAWRLNTDHATALVVSRDTLLEGTRPLYIRDSIVVARGATLRMAPGAHLLMADAARISVYGNIVAEGTPEAPILIEGVRRDNLVTDVNYRLIPGQWEEIRFHSSGSASSLKNVIIRNGRGGIITEAEQLNLSACRVSNMKGSALTVRSGAATVVNSELSNTWASTLRVEGANCHIYYSTLCNAYLFDIRQGTALSIGKNKAGKPGELVAEACVIDGSMTDEFYCDEVSKATFTDCWLRTATQLPGTVKASLPPDSLFLHMGRDVKKDKYDFVYDFRPLPKAPFAALPATPHKPDADRYGVPRGAVTAWGAYEPVAEPKRYIGYAR